MGNKIYFELEAVKLRIGRRLNWARGNEVAK